LFKSFISITSYISQLAERPRREVIKTLLKGRKTVHQGGL
jgi:hypothetical protein